VNDTAFPVEKVKSQKKLSGDAFDSFYGQLSVFILGGLEIHMLS
jgi:hypothetical protein